MLKDDPLYHPRRKAAWYMRTREHQLTRMRQWRRAVHASAIHRLGTRCACCGEQHVTMLEIDHVKGGGHAETKSFNGNNFRIYQKIRDGQHAPGEYQVLCANCNHSKHRNGGTCEHRTETAPKVAHGEFP